MCTVVTRGLFPVSRWIKEDIFILFFILSFFFCTEALILCYMLAQSMDLLIWLCFLFFFFIFGITCWNNIALANFKLGLM